MQGKQEQLHELVNTVTWSGAGIAVVGAITITQWLAIGGLILAAAGFVVNFWHKVQMVRIAKEKLDREFPVGDR